MEATANFQMLENIAAELNQQLISGLNKIQNSSA